MFANLKFENIAVGNCSFGGIIFIYILMICVYNIFMRDEKDDGYTLALPVIIATLLCSSMKNKIEMQPEVYFLDMGHSESCVLTYENKCYVLNGGSTLYKNNGTKTLLPYLYYKGYNRIDGVFLSDTREMNIGGIIQIMDKIKIDKIYIPNSAEHNRYYYKLTELAKKYKSEIVYLNDNNFDEIDENTMFNYITGEQNETN
jgi:beta-lactamase superfamily II metal-dependent hydrolase